MNPRVKYFTILRDRLRTGCSPMRVQMVRHRVKCFAVSVATYCEIFHELPRMKVVDR